MKVELMREIPFKDVPVGGMFLFNEKYFMKTVKFPYENEDEMMCNAVNFNGMEHSEFDDSIDVLWIPKAKVVVE